MSTGCDARDEQRDVSAPDPRATEEVVAVFEVDLGSISVHPTGDRSPNSTIVRNPLSKDFVVQQLVSSCGCVRARLDPEVLPPGGTATLSFELRPSRAGSFLSAITILSEDASIIRVLVAGYAIADLHASVLTPWAEPASDEDFAIRLVAFGKSAREDLPTPRLRLGSGEPLVVEFSGWRRSAAVDASATAIVGEAPDGTPWFGTLMFDASVPERVVVVEIDGLFESIPVSVPARDAMRFSAGADR